MDLCGIMCVMRSITVREAQHNLAQILREVEAGESLEILRRKKPVARLVPIHLPEAGAAVDWAGHAELMKEAWAGVMVLGVESVLDDLRGSR